MTASRERKSATKSRLDPERLQEIARYFLKLGLLGFGGPLALMAAVQKDLVEKRRWTTPERFAQGLALIKALPGPTGTQVAIYMGLLRGGRIGGIVSGTCLILPSFLMMLLLAAFYSSVASLAWSRALLFGMNSAALGVITESVWKLTAPYRRAWIFWLVLALAATVTFWRPSFEPIVILGSGILGVALLKLGDGGKARALLPTALFGAGAVSAPLLGKLAGVMFKAGAFVFGTGLAIVPLLAHEVVDVHHWLTRGQFMDALAFGQITPGPVVITSTFIGYKVAGFAGALLATFCIFAPAFFNILTWFSHAERKLGSSPATKRFVMWAIAAVVGSIAVTVGKLAAAPPDGGSMVEWLAIGIGALSAALFTRLPVWVVIPAGGLLAMLFSLPRF